MTVTDRSRNLCSRALIDELRCPYCAGRLVPESGNDDSMLYGVLRCGCGPSPVVDGIVWLSRRRDGIVPQEDPVIRSVLSKLRRDDRQGALREALVGSFRHWSRRAATMLERAGVSPPRFLMDSARHRLAREVLHGDVDFAGAVALLRNGPYGRYLYHRFANPSILAAIPVILLLRELSAQGGRLIDIGGGAGHASFLIRKFFPALEVILTDADFANLYLARRFMVPGTPCICLDAEARMPFAKNSMDAVFCMDAFHYVREKVGLVQELRRIVRPDGMWLFPHLHNARGENPAAGYPLTPRGYARAFGGLDARFFDEGGILGQFYQDMRLDLREPAALSSKSAGLSMVAGPASLWREHDLSHEYRRILPHLDVNTVYQSRGEAARSLHWPSGELRAECALAAERMEAEPSVHPLLLDRLKRDELSDADRDMVDALVKRFVLVPMPEGYRRGGDQAISTSASIRKASSWAAISLL